MTLKAVLFNFNGVIINDESIQEEVIGEILLQENLRPDIKDYREVCLGRSNTNCLREILQLRGRTVTEAELDKLIVNKSALYQQKLETLETIPTYDGLQEFLQQLQEAELKIALVTEALQKEVETVLKLGNLGSYFAVFVSADEVYNSKPAPHGYLLAMDKLNQKFPDLQLQKENCLVIEDTLVGIEAGKNAGMQVVGVANTYPFHMLQRQANWTVDYFKELELERIQEVFANLGQATLTS
ncbi:MAG: HAD family phosphatase [Spirulinaceae cyanobacterium]